MQLFHPSRQVLPDHRQWERLRFRRCCELARDSAEYDIRERKPTNSGRLLKYPAVGEPRDRGHDRIAPVGKGARAIIQMSASENDGCQKQRPVRESQFPHDRILDQGAEQDLFGQSGRHQDQQEACNHKTGREPRGGM